MCGAIPVPSILIPVDLISSLNNLKSSWVTTFLAKSLPALTFWYVLNALLATLPNVVTPNAVAPAYIALSFSPVPM